MITFVFIKDPEIKPKIVEQQLRKIRLSTEKHRIFIEDLEKESVKRWSQTQGNSIDAALIQLQGILIQ